MPRKPKSDTKGGEPPDRKKKRPPTLGNPDADPVRIHREYVEQRVGGGGEATPEAYDRAIRQWHELPGAVSAPTTEIATDAAAPTPTEMEEMQEDSSLDDEPPA